MTVLAPRLVFGLGSLHRLPTRRARFRLIAAAVESGLTHFDLAPAYGNGLAEHELGRALRELRAPGIAVQTKAGLPIRIYPRLPALYVFPAVRLLDMALGSHAAAYRHRAFAPLALRKSLDASLRRLGVERVQRLYLHEPLRPFEAAEVGPIVQTLEGLVREGKIGEWGIAGPQRRYQGPTALPAHCVQQPLDEWLRLAPAERAPAATLYGVHRSWKAADSKATFPDYVRGLVQAHPGARFLVATGNAERVASLASAGVP